MASARRIRGSASASREMDDEEAAGDLVIEGFEQVAEAQREIFLDDDFVVRRQNAEGLLDDVPIGLENVARFGGRFVKFIADRRDEEDARRYGGRGGFRWISGGGRHFSGGGGY
jgi:hypothetical protein